MLLLVGQRLDLSQEFRVKGDLQQRRNCQAPHQLNVGHLINVSRWAIIHARTQLLSCAEVALKDIAANQ